MAGSNILSAGVRIDTSHAERSLNSLLKSIDRINSSVGKIVSAGNAEKAINNVTNKATSAQRAIDAGVQKSAQTAKNAQLTVGQIHEMQKQRELAAIKAKEDAERAALASKKAQEQQNWNQYLQRFNAQKQYEQQRTQQELASIKNRLMAESNAEDARRAAVKKANKEIDSHDKRVEQSKQKEAKLIAQNQKMAEQAASKEAKQQEKINQQIQKEATLHNQAKKAVDKKNGSLQNELRLTAALTRNLRTLLTTYVGLMGLQAVGDASDTITRAENKLNIINANSLGEAGYNSSGAFSQATKTQTQESLDKMYTAAMLSRSGYADVMNNVSKSMTLAPEAFQGNLDNAIRFQEIMGKAYSLGGASAAEKSSSMYQMIQALGSGRLQGDELRSLTEGAPLAAKMIEKFAQEVYGTTDALKTMGSEGKITSDLVVAAMMQMGDQIDAQFKNMDVTFAEAWTMFKNTALKAFEPVLQKLNDILNKTANSGALDVLTSALVSLANSLYVIFDFVERNWSWLQYVFYAIGVAIASVLTTMALYAIKTAAIWIGSFIAANLPMVLIIGTITLIVTYIIWMAKTAKNTCDFLAKLAFFVAEAVIAALLAVLVVYIATGTIMLSIPVLIGLIILGVIAAIAYVFFKFTGEVIGAAYGIAEVFKTVCSNIGTFFTNLWNSALSMFWNFIGGVLSGLTELEAPLNSLADLLDLNHVNFSGLSKTAYGKAEAASAKANGTYKSVGDAWNTGYSSGYQKGTALQDKINNWGSSLQNKLTLPTNPDYSNAYNIPAAMSNINDNLGDIAKGSSGTDDNTKKIADSMELSEEDLKYLRQIAELEWKKEFTSVNIDVSMNNNNTISGESDLDGLVTKLTAKLEEELAYTASGVYS